MLNQFLIDSLDLTLENLVSACHHLLVCQSTRCSRPECEKLQNAGMIRSKSHSGKGLEEREVVIPIPSTELAAAEKEEEVTGTLLPPCSTSPGILQLRSQREGGGNLQVVGGHPSSDTRRGAIPCHDIIFLFLLVLNRIPLVNL